MSMFLVFFSFFYFALSERRGQSRNYQGMMERGIVNKISSRTKVQCVTCNLSCED